MFDKELTPPPDGRLSSSSGSPDSVYNKGSTESLGTPNFFSQTSTAYKPACQAIPKFKLYDESDFEWDDSLISPPPKKPPTLRKIQRTRSRLIIDNNNLSSVEKTTSNARVIRGNKENNLRPAPQSSPLVTPPHKRMRALQLHDASFNSSTSPVIVMSCRSPTRSRKFSPRHSLFSNNPHKRPQRNSPLASSRKPSINPFTPTRNIKTVQKTLRNQCNSDSGFADDSWLLDVGKHDCSCDMDADDSFNQPDLYDISTCRYKEEFCEEAVIGNGEFGMVFKCINRLDGCTYAIKRSQQPIAGSNIERLARNEVYAQAVLGKHSHVVRYYSAWTEEGYLFIQNEFCNGGSLAEEISTHIKRGTNFTETELKEMLRQIAHGLKYIHYHCLVHMDIKPANIFIQYNPLITQSPESGFEEDHCDDSEITDEVTYKIGDFGHVIREKSPKLEEGDCRYLPKEILNDNHHHLPKADIFSLGLSIYQAATLTELPKNGVEWHGLRDGAPPYMKGRSAAFNSLIKQMVHPNPVRRPSAQSLLSNGELCPAALRSRLELARELSEERFKNQLLSEQLRAVTEGAEMKKPVGTVRPNTRASRMVGVKVNRSKSLTNL